MKRILKHWLLGITQEALVKHQRTLLLVFIVEGVGTIDSTSHFTYVPPMGSKVEISSGYHFVINDIFINPNGQRVYLKGIVRA